ncbi:hypothetical protein EYC80_008079 [Monilinia laxa]|uniref:Uncharacterized protein n=1 Tax=Monilinia laxa TaxID=61186 RepID=A0A5N6JTD3_MONLA|nr:hypothetical protein EYC80_008079 [Monilinia laxa]
MYKKFPFRSLYSITPTSSPSHTPACMHALLSSTQSTTFHSNHGSSIPFPNQRVYKQQHSTAQHSNHSFSSFSSLSSSSTPRPKVRIPIPPLQSHPFTGPPIKYTFHHMTSVLYFTPLFIARISPPQSHSPHLILITRRRRNIKH